MAGVTGIEPALTVLETAILPLNYTPILKLEQVKRIELSQSAWKAEVLPLNYTCFFVKLFGA